MGFLNGLFALLSAVFLVLLIVGLINPSWVKMKSRGKSTLIYFIAMLACSVVVGVTTSDEEKARQKAESEKRQQIELAEKEKMAANEANQTSEEAETVASTNLQKQQSVTDNTLVDKQESPSAPALTGPQKNAVRSAIQYLSLSGFSRDGLIQQLSSSAGDGYDRHDATVAVDSLDVDWNQQAVKSAQQYLDISGFSCNGLIEQLSSKAGDKYTKSQATYGAKQAGACS